MLSLDNLSQLGLILIPLGEVMLSFLSHILSDTSFSSEDFIAHDIELSDKPNSVCRLPPGRFSTRSNFPNSYIFPRLVHPFCPY